MSSSSEEEVSNSESEEEEVSESGEEESGEEESGEEESEEESGEETSEQESDDESEEESEDSDSDSDSEEEAEEKEEKDEDSKDNAPKTDDNETKEGEEILKKRKKRVKRKEPGPAPPNPGPPPIIKDLKDVDLQLSEEVDLCKNLAPCKTRNVGLNEENTRFLTIGNFERNFLKEKNVKYSQIVEENMIPNFISKNNAKGMIENHLNDEMEPRKLPKSFRKLHKDGNNIVYILDDFSIYNTINGERVRFEDIVDSNDENFMKNIVAYGTVVQHPPNIIVPDDNGGEEEKDIDAIKPMPHKPRKQRKKKKAKKKGSSRRRMNQIEIVLNPMSNEEAYQKAKEYMLQPDFQLPIQLGPALSIISLGTIPTENTTLYHKTDILYPVGFLSRRLYTSIRNPREKAMYESSIVASPKGPIFRVRLPKRNDDEEDIVYEEISASKAWLNVLHAVNRRRKEIGETPRGSAMSGPEMYGIGNNQAHKTIKALMEGIDNVLLCEDYVFMTNRAPSKRKKKNSGIATNKKQKMSYNAPRNNVVVSQPSNIKIKIKLNGPNGPYAVKENTTTTTTTNNNNSNNNNNNSNTKAAGTLPVAQQQQQQLPATTMMTTTTTTTMMTTTTTSTTSTTTGVVTTPIKPDVNSNPEAEGGDEKMIQYVQEEDREGDIARIVSKLKKQIPKITKSEIKKISKKCKSLKKKMKKLKKNADDENLVSDIKKVLSGFLTLRVNKKVVNKSSIGKVIGKLAKYKKNSDIRTLAKSVKKAIIKQLDKESKLRKSLKKKRKSLTPTKHIEGITIVKLPPPNAIEDFTYKSETSSRSEDLKRVRVIIRNVKGWKFSIGSDYGNPCLWIKGKMSLFKIHAPALIGRIGLKLNAAPWYDDVFESFNRKIKAVYYAAGALQDFIPFRKKNDMNYRRILETVDERVGKVEDIPEEQIVSTKVNANDGNGTNTTTIDNNMGDSSTTSTNTNDADNNDNNEIKKESASSQTIITKVVKPLLNENYYFSHARFIEKMFKLADVQEMEMEKKNPTDEKYWLMLPENRYQIHEFLVKLIAKGPRFVSIYRERRNKLLVKQYNKKKGIYDRWVATQERRALRKKKLEEERKRKEEEKLAAIKVDDMILYEEELKNPPPEGKRRPNWPAPTVSDICGVDLCIVQQVVLAIQFSNRFSVFQYSRHYSNEFGDVFELMKGIHEKIDYVPRRGQKLLGNGVLPDLYIGLMKCILKLSIEEWGGDDDDDDDDEDDEEEDDDEDDFYADHILAFKGLQKLLNDKKTVNGVWQDVLRRMIITLNGIDVDLIEDDTFNAVKKPLNTVMDYVMPDGIDLCRKVLTRCMGDPVASDFNIDIRLLIAQGSLPDYEKIIKKPMDFATLLRRIDEGYYNANEGDGSSIQKVGEDAGFKLPEPCMRILADATLVWQNCLEYWNVQGYHSVIEKAKEIRDIFKTEWIDNVVKPLKCQYEIELSAMKTSTSTTNGAMEVGVGKCSSSMTWEENKNCQYYDDTYELRLGKALETLRKNEYEAMTPEDNAIVLNYLLEYIQSRIDEVHDDIKEGVEEAIKKRNTHRENKVELKKKLKEKVIYDKEKEEKEKTRQLEIVNEQRKKDEEYARRLAAGLSRRSIRAVQPVNYDETGGSNDNNVKDKYENLPTLKQLDFQYEREISYLEKRHLPVGKDKFFNKYYIYPKCLPDESYPVALFVEHHVSGNWYMYKTIEEFQTMLQSLNTRGIRESKLYDELNWRADNIKEGMEFLQDTRRRTTTSNKNDKIGVNARLNQIKSTLIKYATKVKLPRSIDETQWKVWMTKVNSLQGNLSNTIPLVLEYEQMLYQFDVLKWTGKLHDRRLWIYACSNAKSLSYLHMKIIQLKQECDYEMYT